MTSIKFAASLLLAALILTALACTTPEPLPLPTLEPLPTHTPYPTLTPLATHTPYPTLTPLATHTPYPTLTPLATLEPLPTHTPYPTATRRPTYTPAPTPTRTFADKWNVPQNGHLIGKSEVLVACYWGTSFYPGTTDRYWAFNADGSSRSSLWALVEGERKNSFVKGSCYRLGVRFLWGYEKVEGASYAQTLAYNLLHADAYEKLTVSEYQKYLR